MALLASVRYKPTKMNFGHRYIRMRESIPGPYLIASPSTSTVIVHDVRFLNVVSSPDYT